MIQGKLLRGQSCITWAKVGKQAIKNHSRYPTYECWPLLYSNSINTNTTVTLSWSIAIFLSLKGLCLTCFGHHLEETWGTTKHIISKKYSPKRLMCPSNCPLPWHFLFWLQAFYWEVCSSKLTCPFTLVLLFKMAISCRLFHIWSSRSPLAKADRRDLQRFIGATE